MTWVDVVALVVFDAMVAVVAIGVALMICLLLDSRTRPW